MERIAILGHSFVARLEQDLADGHIEGLHANLGLPENFTVKYFGVRDSTLNNLLNSKEFEECKAFHPTKVFLQIGEDDVGHTTSTIMDIVQAIRIVVGCSLLAFDSLKYVVIGSLFRRNKSRGLTAEDYNFKVHKINLFLQKFYSANRIVQFWNTRGLMVPKWDIWTADGTRLNQTATRKYYLQIRMAMKCEKYR